MQQRSDTEHLRFIWSFRDAFGLLSPHQKWSQLKGACQEEKQGERTDVSRTRCKLSGNRSDGMISLNLTFLIQIVTNMYRGGQEKSTTVSIYSHL